MAGFLYVEGKDDMHSIVHLLNRHGVDFNEDRRPCEIRTTSEKDETGGVEKLLDSIEIAVRRSKGWNTGFVLDADSPLQNRWDSVKNHLHNVGVPDLPKIPPQEGFIDYSETYKTKVGAWLMPDNQNDGKLETFLQSLIAEEDNLIGHAQIATKIAKEKGAEFSENDTIKAELHAWLAWQEEPGKPYGTAITARYFQNHESPAALAFVAWFKKLYEIA